MHPLRSLLIVLTLLISSTNLPAESSHLQSVQQPLHVASERRVRLKSGGSDAALSIPVAVFHGSNLGRPASSQVLMVLVRLDNRA